MSKDKRVMELREKLKRLTVEELQQIQRLIHFLETIESPPLLLCGPGVSAVA